MHVTPRERVCSTTAPLSAIALLVLGVAAAAAPPSPPPAPFAMGHVAEVAARLGRTVVHINATFKQDKEARRPTAKPLFTPDAPPRNQAPLQKTGQGSGFLWRADGTILTNQHVIEDAAHLEVVLDNGFHYEARILGESEAYDLAVLRIDDPLFLPPLPDELVGNVGDSRGTRVGDWVMAIGSPLSLDRSVTLGIISAKGRELHVGEERTYYNLLQTDAAINPGNSGGPLISLSGGGRIIAINTAIHAAGQGLGFAIPINLALKIARDLEETGEVRHSWLGLDLSLLGTQRALEAGLDHARAVLVSGVAPDSPAAGAGIEEGDILLRANGNRVAHPTHVLEVIAESPIGAEVTLELHRPDDNEQRVMRVAEAPEGSTDRIRISSDTFGAKVRTVVPADFAALGLPRGFQGVIVVAVTPGSPAHEAGLRPSDAVATVSHEDVADPEAFREALGEVPAGKSPKLGVFRGGYWIFLPR